ncbi:MAG: HlyC/CorC family transporter [Nonomuraea sp.]|nr:HlyC/CorC family transporter [Nonomuraea sp.]
MTVQDVVVIVLLLAANGFFVGAEFALISTRRTQMEPLAQAGSRRARAVIAAMGVVPTMLAAAQLGVTLASLILGAVAEPVVAHALEGVFGALGLPDSLVDPVALALALLLVVSLHVIIGEMVPKNLALSGPDRAALWLVPPLLLLARVTRPVLAVVRWMADGVLRLLRIPPSDDARSVYTSDELPSLIEESRGHRLLGQDERDRMIATLSLHAQPVSSVMVPIADVVSVPSTTGVAGLQEHAGRYGHSRFPVYGEHPADLRGYLHVLDALNGRALEVRALPRVPTTATLAEVLATMRVLRAQLVAVTDESDAVQGVVTLEDLLRGLLRPA